MPIKSYRRTELTGGGTDALDGITGVLLHDGDIASVYLTDTEQLYFYRLDADSGAVEDSPNVITPNIAPGSKRWILQKIFTNIVCDDFTLGDIVSIGNYDDDLATVVDTTSTIILVINKEITLTGDVTVPENITLWFTRSGLINLGNYNLTINGSLDAPLRQIFDYTGSGVVTFGDGSVKEVYPQWWGALGDYNHDDTNAIQYAINSFSNIFIPTGRYKISTITISNYKCIDGVRANDKYDGEPTTGSVLKCFDSLQSDPIIYCDDSIVSNNKVTIKNIAIVGATKTVAGHDGIKCNYSGGYLNVENVNIYNCRSGINVNYSGVSKINGCTIHQCYFGVSSCIDSRITNCFIAGCSSYGLNLQDGNDNIIANNKIEWNGHGTSGYNIELNSANNCVIAGNIVDHAGAFGIHGYDCTRLTVVGNMFKGNGHDVPGDYDYDYHARFTSCENVIFNDNMTKLNPYGDGLTPKRSVRLTTCDMVLISNNDLSGTVSGTEQIVTDSDCTNVRIFLNAPFTPVRTSGIVPNLGREICTIYGTDSDSDSTAELETIKTLSLNAYEIGRLYHLDCISRNMTTGIRYYATLTFIIKRDVGDAEPEYGITTQWEAKTLRFGFIGTGKDIEYTLTTNTDGSEIYILIENTTTSTNYQVDTTLRT